MNDSWNPDKQFDAMKVTPELLTLWEETAQRESHRLRLGDWNWPMMVRSLIAALKEKTP